MKKLTKITIYSVICGIILTLATLFLGGQPIGGGPIGFPFPGLHSTVLPSNSGYTFDWTGLILDILIWSVVSFVILFVYFKKKK
jgi:hypothetical protein